jgi:hypothetical protein
VAKTLLTSPGDERSWGTAALLTYAALSVVMTWPLLPGLARDVPGDLGDSLLNMWILGWGAEHVPRLLTGQASLADYWNANIFHPEPLALGFSEHLFGEVLQILPIYWLTGNLILCYNLLFLSSFALSGFGMFLLVRDLLQHPAPSAGAVTVRHSTEHVVAAAFVAGLIFAFVPFRIAQVAHIQSLHAEWMPLALFGFRRFIATSRTRALAGGAAALLMQNWSNGYYLIFFAPFVPLFVVHQMWTHGRLREVRTWLAFIAAAGVVAVGTWPFLALYLATERVHAFERPLGEVIAYSADVYSYLTAPEALRVWGDVLRTYPKPEGELFFGGVPWLLTAIALIVAAHGAYRVAATRTRRDILVWTIVAIVITQALGVLAIAFTGGFITSFLGIPIRATNATRILVGIAVMTAALFVISPSARASGRRALRSPLLLCTMLAVLAMWLSLGPLPQSRGRALAGLGLYSALYEHVPGFAGLRVPARYAMIAAMFLSVTAGYGALVVVQRFRNIAAVTVAMCVLWLGEAWFAPMPRNLTSGSTFAEAPARVYPRDDAPPVYHQLANLRPDAVVAEFPFGDPTWELRYVYYSTVHWRGLVNGYSGGFPQGYRARVALFQRVQENPDAAWRALRDAGTTHVVVHERAFRDGEGAVITQWLRDHFAVEIARFDGDLLFDVTGVWPPR